MGDSQELDASPRLIFLLRKIRDGLAQSLDSIKQGVTAADGTLPHLQVDGQDVKEAAICLRDAGLKHAGLRLAREFDQLQNRCMDEWLAAMADGEFKEDRDKLVELFGSFPNDSVVEDRMVAIAGCAAQLAEFVGELVDSQPPAVEPTDATSDKMMSLAEAKRIFGFRTPKELDWFLKKHPEVQQDRPLTKAGTPHKRRRTVSVLGLSRAIAQDDKILSDPARRRRMESRLHKASLGKRLEDEALAYLGFKTM
jgi:hypothetical protein